MKNSFSLLLFCFLFFIEQAISASVIEVDYVSGESWLIENGKKSKRLKYGLVVKPDDLIFVDETGFVIFNVYDNDSFEIRTINHQHYSGPVDVAMKIDGLNKIGLNEENASHTRNDSNVCEMPVYTKVYNDNIDYKLATMALCNYSRHGSLSFEILNQNRSKVLHRSGDLRFNSEAFPLGKHIGVLRINQKIVHQILIEVVTSDVYLAEVNPKKPGQSFQQVLDKMAHADYSLDAIRMAELVMKNNRNLNALDKQKIEEETRNAILGSLVEVHL